jgi:ectoine hydroxylase-related dioxygenase (phytanoyl-CoA dioxygenase family)
MPVSGKVLARQQENMTLSVPPEIAATLPARVQELLGYAIRPPFMGHVDGLHPQRLLRRQRPLPPGRGEAAE